MTQALKFLAYSIATSLAALALVSCGSGAVSAPSTPATPGPLAITPGSATLYSELPTSFVISGGTPPYFVTSSNQAAVPVIGTVTGSSFTVVPNPVATETPVTLTLTDSASATAANATLTVRPRTVSNVITVTPSASQSAACGTSICAGGDAEVRVVLSQNGVPLAGRTVRFDVISGEFRIITSAPGLAEALSTTGSTLTDSSGTARMRIRVLSDASPQTALLQITDVNSGAFQRASVPIAPSSSSPLNAQPDRISFVGPNGSSCANGISADVIIFGGRPPYQVSRPGTFNIDRDTVTASGGRFTITANGQCVGTQPIAIVDNNGATVTVTASNSLGSTLAGTPVVATPSTVTLDSCVSIANVVLSGGSGSYLHASGSGALEVRKVSENRFSIQRLSGSAPAASPVQVGFSDGRTVTSVTVTLSGSAPGQGAGQC